MSWLASHWYGVFALFGVPAAIGVFCWLIAHHVMGQGERHYREREARKRSHLQFPARRR